MTMLTFAPAALLAPLLMLQGAGETAIAIQNDTPETWTVEYPRIIMPFIDDYRRCLNVANRTITGKADFEAQHRSDLPRCEDVSRDAQANANRVLANRAEYEEYTKADISEVFAHLGRIHVARGADLDHQFTMRMQVSTRAVDDYNENKPKGLVLELHDASVVKARIEETASQYDGPTNVKN